MIPAKRDLQKEWIYLKIQSLIFRRMNQLQTVTNEKWLKKNPAILIKILKIKSRRFVRLMGEVSKVESLAKEMGEINEPDDSKYSGKITDELNRLKRLTELETKIAEIRTAISMNHK